MVVEQTTRGTSIGARVASEAQARLLDWLDHEIVHVSGSHASPVVSKVLERAADGDSLLRCLLYFLLFDPDAPPASDPRPLFPLNFFAPGTGRLLARTSWDTNAAWFTYRLGWVQIDHQLGDGNQIEFYRKGEWLTKERTGYDLDGGASDNHNTLALENDPPEHNEPGDYRRILWERGSQWTYNPAGDPSIAALSLQPGFVHVAGDATPLYNSTYEGTTNVLHASRSLLWIKPDFVVVLDRARSGRTDRFKRFWLNLPAQAAVSKSTATVRTASGQQLRITSLLPAEADRKSTRLNSSH